MQHTVTLAEWDRFLVDQGYDSRSRAILTATIERRLAEQQERERAGQEVLETAPSRPLSLAEMEQAYLAGIIQRTELVAFLAGQNLTARAVEILLAAADAGRQAREIAEEQRRLREEAIEPRRLTLQQERSLFVAGFISPEEFEAFLVQEGFTPRDRELLVQQALADQREAQEIQAAQPEPKLTVAQQQQAYILGLVSEGQFLDFLAQSGYAPAEASLLLGIARAEKLRRQQEALRPPPAPPRAPSPVRARELRSLTLAQFKDALEAGLAVPEEFRHWLVLQGYDARSREILTALVLPPAA